MAEFAYVAERASVALLEGVLALLESVFALLEGSVALLEGVAVLGLALLTRDTSTLGWLGGEVKVTKKKVQMIFLPLMVLGNESPKEF